jgi:hypothetical protein
VVDILLQDSRVNPFLKQTLTSNTLENKDKIIIDDRSLLEDVIEKAMSKGHIEIVRKIKRTLKIL